MWYLPSSEFASLMSRMNQTVADHAIWIDKYYMYGNASNNDQSIHEIVENLRQAVKVFLPIVNRDLFQFFGIL